MQTVSSISDVRRYLGLLVVASVIVTIPMFIWDVSGDTVVNLVYTECFARQFWQGDWYPRWCFDANDGLGGAPFIIYFPAAYYAGSLLVYPFTFLGLPLITAFHLFFLLTTIAMAWAYFSWLRDIVISRYAFWGTLIFLCMPYRMEVVYSRTAYAELFSMMLLPLLFKYVRNIHQHDKSAMVLVAIVVALLLLSHTPVALIGILFSGAYLLCVGGLSKRTMMYFGAATVWGGAAAAFFLLPAKYYQHFMVQIPKVDGPIRWCNGFISLYVPLECGIAFVIVSLLFFLLSYVVCKNRLSIPDMGLRKEVSAWIFLGALAFVLSMPVTEPLYNVTGIFEKLLFPWRMQVVYLFSVPLLVVTYVQWIITEKRKKTLKSDSIILSLLLLLPAVAMVHPYTKESQFFIEQFRKLLVIHPQQYQFQWADEHHWGEKYVIKRYETDADKTRLTLTAGHGELKLDQWNWRKISFAASSAKGMTVHLDHYYFPVWQARDEAGNLLNLLPQPETGHMLVEVPAGKHEVVLVHSVVYGNPVLVYLANTISLLAGTGMLCALLSRRKYSRKT